MPKISGSSDDMLRMVLERDDGALDSRLRNILVSQLADPRDQAGNPAPPPLDGSAAGTVHRVKVSLRGAKPPVWRRIELPSDMRLDLVHEALQTAFGWIDCHYHQFETDYGEYGDPTQNADTWRADESDVALAQVAGEARARIGYVYDFGADWRHDLQVEAVSPAAPGVRYPRCTGGRGQPPAESSGGIRAHNEARAEAGSPAVDATALTSALHGLSRVVVPAQP
jgi:hypothetical protein